MKIRGELSGFRNNEEIDLIVLEFAESNCSPGSLQLLSLALPCWTVICPQVGSLHVYSLKFLRYGYNVLTKESQISRT